MARLSVILTVAFTVIFFLLTLSHARIPSNIPENEVIGNVLPATSLPESDVVNPMIHLPSDAADNYNAAESHSSDDPSGETTESESADVAAIPLRLARFRPVNRHFRLQSRLPFRLCRHHHHHHHPLFKHLMRERAEIPYSDDMILSTGENSDFDPMMFHTGSGERQIPPTRVKFHHQHQHEDEDNNEGMSKFLFKHSDRFGKEKFKKHMLRHHEEDENETENEEERSKEHMMMMKSKKNKKEEKEVGGFMKRIRKILDHF